jgi:hypothetical protein
MQLRTLLEDFPEFSIATHADNEDILEFYHDHQMQTDSLQIFYDRGTNFFDLLEVQGERQIVFIYRNKENKVKGVATISLRKQVVDGNEVEVLYLGDLRSKADRGTSKRWKLLYSLLMKHINQIEEFKSL